MAPRNHVRPARSPSGLYAATLILLLASCASVQFERSTETSGTFESTGWAFTIFKIDLPKSAMQIARENASDSNLANMQIDETRVVPDLGWFNWVLDIISIRFAKITGTWGYEGD